MIFVLIGRTVLGYFKFWADCLGCALFLHFVGGFVLLIFALMAHDNYMSKPAGAPEIAELRAAYGTCPVYTLGIRAKEAKKKDPSYVISRRDVAGVLSDCRDLYSAQEQQAAQAAIFDLEK
jgi:hypothetical protein